MAEALAAIGGAASILSIIDVLARSIGIIGDLRQEWKTADLTVLDLLAQLKAIRAALSEIHRWTTSDHGLEPHFQLKMDLDDSVTWCSILAEMIDKLLSDLDHNPDDSLSRTSKAKLLFASKEMENLQKMIDRQASALTLLLSACRLPTALEQKGLLERSSSRKVLRKLADDSASLIVHRDSSSLFTYYTDNQSKLSRTFDFDLEVFSSKAYERAIRGALKTVVRQRRGELEAVQRRNAEIDRMLLQDRKRQEREVRILLLGAGGSDVSLFLKQMRLIHAGGFSRIERKQWRIVMFSNLVTAFQIIVAAMEELQIDFEDDDNMQSARYIATDPEISLEEPFPQEALTVFTRLWEDKGVQMAMLKGDEYELHDNLEYFMEDIGRFFLPTYLPTDQDIVRTRGRSTGAKETVFDLGNLTYRMSHISGQRSERKKWIHMFDNVQIVLFLAPLAGYDLALIEDRNGNQMHEALMLFESVVNAQYFEKSAIIVMLSDVSLFREKISCGMSPIQRHWPDYSGLANDVVAAQNFFAQKFKSLVRNPSKEVYIHYVDVQDTDLLKKVMISVQDMIVQRNMNQFRF